MAAMTMDRAIESVRSVADGIDGALAGDPTAKEWARCLRGAARAIAVVFGQDQDVIRRLQAKVRAADSVGVDVARDAGAGGSGPPRPTWWGIERDG